MNHYLDKKYNIIKHNFDYSLLEKKDRLTKILVYKKNNIILNLMRKTKKVRPVL